MSITTEYNGRLCNQVIRNLALSILAEKYDLYVEYSNYDNINNKLGIELFIGNKIYNKTELIDEEKYMHYFNNNINNNANFYFMLHYFQSEEISTILHNHLSKNKKNIIDKNPYKERYKNNNDIFLHIRLGDVAERNYFDINYYIYCINCLDYDNIYIGTDSFDHELIKKLKTLYPSIIFFDKNPVETIQFGSTCKNIIVSHGSFSAVIAYLGFFSTVYFLHQEPTQHAPLGLFLNKGFIPIFLIKSVF